MGSQNILFLCSIFGMTFKSYSVVDNYMLR